MNGIELIAAERQRQIADGYNAEHDDKHNDGQLALAAVCYALREKERNEKSIWVGDDLIAVSNIVTAFAPWRSCQIIYTQGDRMKELVIAGAFIAAEIDRMLRAKGEA